MDPNLTPFRAPDGSYSLRPRIDDLFEAPVNTTDSAFHETPRNYDYLDGETFNYSPIDPKEPQDSPIHFGRQHAPNTPRGRIYGLDPHMDNPFTNGKYSERRARRANGMDSVDETPSTHKLRKSPESPIDVGSLKPAQTRLENNLRQDRFHQANLNEGESGSIQYPNRSSSLPQDANLAENSLPQPNVENGSWVQLNGDVVFMYHTVPGSLPLVEFNQENNEIPAWHSNQEIRNNSWYNEDQSSEHYPGSERESYRESMHERAAFEQGFTPIRKSNAFSGWFLFWRSICQQYGICLELFDNHPGEISTHIKRRCHVMNELDFKATHGGFRLLQTATRMGGIVLDFSDVSEHYNPDEENFQSVNFHTIHNSAKHDIRQPDFPAGTQAPAHAAIAQENKSPDVNPGVLIEYQDQFSSSSNTQSIHQQALNKIEPLSNVEENLVDMPDHPSSVKALKDAFPALSTSNPQALTLAVNREETPELDSFEQWCMEGNAEREITPVEQQSFSNFVMSGYELQSAPANSSETRPVEVQEAEDHQPATTRRDGVSLRWWWRA